MFHIDVKFEGQRILSTDAIFIAILEGFISNS